jgi:hypothetical protein
LSTQRDKITEYISRMPGRDDDEIARALGIPQRQAVNMICRKLADEQTIERALGPRGKIVNHPIGRKPPSKEAPQTQIELEMRSQRLPLKISTLTEAGFRLAGHWRIGGDDKLQFAGDAPKEKGVYAFTTAELVRYVGVASMGLKKRLYFYGRPGSTQRTNIRINAAIIDALRSSEDVSVYTATPPNFEWNGLTINGRAGLEIGLIEAFHLPWNVRGVLSA